MRQSGGQSPRKQRVVAAEAKTSWMLRPVRAVRCEYLIIEALDRIVRVIASLVVNVHVGADSGAKRQGPSLKQAAGEA